MSDQFSARVQKWIDEYVAWRDRVPTETERVLDGVRSLKLHMPTRALICSDGSYIIPIDRPVSVPDIEAMIGADALDTVSLTDGVHVMCVDDLSVAKKLPINALATRFYYQKCRREVPYMIRGDVVIVPDSDFAPAHMRGLYEP